MVNVISTEDLILKNFLYKYRKEATHLSHFWALKVQNTLQDEIPGPVQTLLKWVKRIMDRENRVCKNIRVGVLHLGFNGFY